MGSIIKSIEYFEVSFSGTSTTDTLTKGQDTSDCIPFFSYYNNDTTISGLRNIITDIYFSGGDTINFSRESNTGTIYAKGWVVEFNPDYVTVQQGTFNITNGNNSDDVSISTIVEADSFIIAYSGGNNTAGGAEDNCVIARFSDANTAQFRRGDTQEVTDGHFYVAESTLFVTQNNNNNMNGLTSDNMSISAVNLAKTFLVASRRVYTSDQRPDRRGMNVRLSSSTNIAVTRNVSGSVIENVYAFVVECAADEFTVQRGNADKGSGTTKDVDITHRKANDYAMVLGGIVDIGTEGTSNSNADVGQAQAEYKFLDDDTIRITTSEASSGTGNDASWQIVEWLPPSYMGIHAWYG